MKPPVTRTGKESWVGRLSPETLDQPLERLGLSTRPARCLRRVESIRVLLERPESEIAALHGFGQGCLLEVRLCLARFVLDHLRLPAVRADAAPGAGDPAPYLAAWNGPPQPRPLGQLLDEFIELVIRSRPPGSPASVRPASGTVSENGHSARGCNLEQVAAELFAAVPDRDRRLLERRFSPSTLNPPTLAELGRESGLTRERVRQILNATLTRLSHDAEARRRRPLTEFLVHQFRRHGGLLREEELLPLLLAYHPGGEAEGTVVLRIALAVTADFAGVEPGLWCAHPWKGDTARLALQSVLRAIRNQQRWLSPAQARAYCRSCIPNAEDETALLAACMRVHPRLHTLDGSRFGLREWEEDVPSSLQERLACCLRLDGAPLTAVQLVRRLAEIVPDEQLPGTAEVLATLHAGEPFHPTGRGYYALRGLHE